MADTPNVLVLEQLLPKYTEAEVAQFLRVSVRTVQAWRLKGHGGPNYVKVGGHIRYSEQSLIEYIQSQTVDQQKAAN